VRLHHRSYLKTCLLSGLATAGGFGGALLTMRVPSTPIYQFVAVVSCFVCLIAGIITIAGLAVFWRDHASMNGHEDVFLSLNRSRSEENLACCEVSRLSLCLGAVWPGRFRRLRVGDEVQVRPLAEIQATLDADATLEGLPFQPEMVAHCGRRFRVYRCIDKIHDYGRTGKMRRVTNAVSLTGLRCDGSAHDSCQARCYLIWKEAWLRPVWRSADGQSGSYEGVGVGPAPSIGASGVRLSEPASDQSASAQHEKRFRCQFTQLAAASVPLRAWDVRQDFRPLVSGNVTLRAFGIAMLTRLFNHVQGLRHGVTFPVASSGESAAPPVPAPIALGERVRVRRAVEIATTLDVRGRNRGLWFDLDMLKHCGRCYEVAGRIERIIDAATGRMLQMKTPCLTLGGVSASGEFLRLCPQHEPIFWREVWLKRAECDVQSPATVAS
jgi:hypothetical protein